MPSFSAGSKGELAECHADIQLILGTAILYVDFGVSEGNRSEERQNALFRKKRTQVQFPNSKHNLEPSEAVDVFPYPVDWENREEFTYLAGILVGISIVLYELGKTSHILRWGGDWDRDGDLDDNKFDDLPHLELFKPAGRMMDA